jgi:hypothetical protein
MIRWQITVQFGDRGAVKEYGSWAEVVQAIRATVVPLLPTSEQPRVLLALSRGVSGAGSFHEKGNDWHIVAQRLPDSDSWVPGVPLQQKDLTA